MRVSRPAVFVALLCVPALAQDDPAKKPDAPAAPSAPEAPKADAAKAEAKKERQVDPAGMKALERHAGLMALPSSAGVKDVAVKAELDQMGTKIKMDGKWNAAAGFDVDVTVPDEIKEQAAAQGVDEAKVKSEMKKQMEQLGLGLLFEAPGRTWTHYNVASKTEGDQVLVDLTPFDDEADAVGRKFVFGKDGLIKTSSTSPKVDPESPQAAMMDGQWFETTWAYEKKGDKSLLKGRTTSVMGTQIESTVSYFDGPGGAFLPKDMTITLPQGELVVTFHDYVVNGKPVESTKQVEEKPAEKPAAPAPAKPADEPPAPPAPAPGK